MIYSKILAVITTNICLGDKLHIHSRYLAVS